MTGATLANSPLLYGLIAVGLLAVVAFALYSFVKARKRCLELGMSKEKINNVVKSSISFSIVPSIAILIGLLTLTPALGAAWPWWRLSVIGSLSYEIMAADYTVQGIGSTMSQILTSDPSVFSAVMWVMTLGVVSGPLIVILIAKKYSTGIMKSKSSSNDWGQIFSGVFFLALFSVYIPALIMNNLPYALTMFTAMILTVIIGIIGKKLPWLNNFTMAIVLLLSMGASVIWDKLF